VLGEGELSVGVSADIEHVAATPLGATVKAGPTSSSRRAALLVRGQRPRRGGLIGEGRHARAIVRVERLLAAAPPARR
jgi:predicted thioesterase